MPSSSPLLEVPQPSEAPTPIAPSEPSVPANPEPPQPIEPDRERDVPIDPPAAPQTQ